MINFKDRQDVGPSAVIAASLLLLLVTLVYMVVVPKPTSAGLASGRARSLKKLRMDTANAQASGESSRARTAERLYEGDEENVTARVLAGLNGRAQRVNVQIAAFRPQKAQPIAGVVELPLTLTVTGPYPRLLAFLKTLQTADSKVVLRSVQAAAAGGATNAVTATVGVSVFCADSAPAAALGTTRASARPVGGGNRG